MRNGITGLAIDLLWWNMSHKIFCVPNIPVNMIMIKFNLRLVFYCWQYYHMAREVCHIVQVDTKSPKPAFARDNVVYGNHYSKTNHMKALYSINIRLSILELDVTKRRKLQPNCSPRKFRIFRIGLSSLYILYFFWCYSQMPPKESKRLYVFMKYSFPSSRLLWPQICQCCISHCVATSICSIKSS